MTDLQKLALRHISKLANELSFDINVIGNKVRANNNEFNDEEHSYPHSTKAREIKDWSDAIIKG